MSHAFIFFLFFFTRYSITVAAAVLVGDAISLKCFQFFLELRFRIDVVATSFGIFWEHCWLELDKEWLCTSLVELSTAVVIVFSLLSSLWPVPSWCVRSSSMLVTVSLLKQFCQKTQMLRKFVPPHCFRLLATRSFNFLQRFSIIVSDITPSVFT